MLLRLFLSALVPLITNLQSGVVSRWKNAKKQNDDKVMIDAKRLSGGIDP